MLVGDEPLIMKWQSLPTCLWCVWLQGFAAWLIAEILSKCRTVGASQFILRQGDSSCSQRSQSPCMPLARYSASLMKIDNVVFLTRDK